LRRPKLSTRKFSAWKKKKIYEQERKITTVESMVTLYGSVNLFRTNRLVPTQLDSRCQFITYIVI